MSFGVVLLGAGYRGAGPAAAVVPTPPFRRSEHEHVKSDPDVVQAIDT